MRAGRDWRGKTWEEKGMREEELVGGRVEGGKPGQEEG
jgi:hypothetical protein